jgi:hypothetical protein
MALKHYAVCLHHNFGPDFSGADLIPGKTYRLLGEERGALRIVDETGEDYLYPASAFRVLNDDDSRILAESLEEMAA